MIGDREKLRQLVLKLAQFCEKNGKLKTKEYNGKPVQEKIVVVSGWALSAGVRDISRDGNSEYQGYLILTDGSYGLMFSIDPTHGFLISLSLDKGVPSTAQLQRLAGSDSRLLNQELIPEGSLSTESIRMICQIFEEFSRKIEA